MPDLKFEIGETVTLTGNDQLRVGMGDIVLRTAELKQVTSVEVRDGYCYIEYATTFRRHAFPPLKTEGAEEALDSFLEALRGRLPRGVRVVDKRPGAAHPAAPPEPRGVRFWITHTLGWVNLCYVGILPAAATFAIIDRYGTRLPALLVFILGAVVVGLELAMLGVYTRFPRSVLLALLMLVDGPVLTLLSGPGDPHLLDFAIRGFLIDGSSVVLAVCLLGITDGLGTMFVVGFFIPFAGIVALFWPYLASELPHTATAIGALALGTAWATVTNHRILSLDNSARDPTGGAAAYLLVFVLVWAAAMWSATVMHAERVKRANRANRDRAARPALLNHSARGRALTPAALRAEKPARRRRRSRTPAATPA